MKSQDLYHDFVNNPQIKNQWGQEFFRDVFIPELLGSNTHSILYWAGKRMAREFPIMNMDDLITFFAQSNFGILSVDDSKNDNSIIFKLTGPIVKERLAFKADDTDFMFEAGFLAQSIEHQLEITSEAEMDPKKTKKGIVTIVVHTDPNQPAIDLASEPDLKINPNSDENDDDKK